MKFMENRIKVLLILIGIFIVVWCINIEHVFYDYIERVLISSKNETVGNLTISKNVTTIIKSCRASPQLALATDIIQVLMRFLLPFPIMLALNIILSRRFIQSRKKIVRGGDSMKREYNFTFTVIAMNMYETIYIHKNFFLILDL
jgi:hypothetical protein